VAPFTEMDIDLTAVEEALAQHLTLPLSWYSDPTIHAFEREVIFRRGWHYAGPLRQVKEPGDILVTQAGDVPVVVTRDRAGALHGLVNVCRHRGYPVVRASCSRGTMQCAYHAWTYDLDGTLRKAPRAEYEADFDTSELSLLPVSVDAWGGFVWVNADPDASAFLDEFPELEILAAERGGLDLAGYQAGHQRFDSQLAANWKIAIENLVECYHCPTIHKSTFAEVFELDRDRYEYLNRGRIIEHYAPRKIDRGKLPDNLRAGGSDGRLIVLWPSSYIFVEGVFAMASVFIPTGPETTRQITDIWSREELDEQLVADWADFHTKAFEEDIEVVGALQPAIRSGIVPYGRLLAESEVCVAYFHRMVLDAYSQALSAMAP
jgi:phenylpropionate dioxygenase-like ring-hydroxylating dioxygenase large terminal subunit